MKLWITRLPKCTEIKINQLQVDVVTLFHHVVCWLYISVNDTMAVEILQSKHHLPCCLFLVVFGHLSYIISKRSTIHAWHDKVHSFLCLVNICNPNQLGMIHKKGNFELVLEHCPLINSCNG